MLDVFKVKAYDLTPVYVAWTDAPIYFGKPREDIDVWLENIKNGCIHYKVPKEHWYRVGRHYLGPKPRDRLEQLAKVMQQMSGDKHVWNWDKFEVAVKNLGYSTPTRSLSRSLSIPSFSKEKKQKEKEEDNDKSSKENINPVPTRPVPKKQGSWWVLGKDKEKEKEKKEKDDDDNSIVEVIVAKSETVPPPIPATGLVPVDPSLTSVSKAPAWLVNACTALDYLTVEYPRVMSAMSAILITIGAIPTIPGLGATAGGALLTSGPAQAIGAVASGVGHWLKAQQDGQVQVANAPAAS